MEVSYFFYIALGLAIVTFYDIFITVLSHQGAGPITHYWTKTLWSLVLWHRYKFNSDQIIKRIGPVILILIIIMWYLLLKLSWVLFFLASSSSIIDKNSPIQHIDVFETLYFIGETFSTVGYGDYLPNGLPWTILATIGATVVTTLISFAISYIIPVVTAVIDRRRIITSIDSIGSSSEELLDTAWGQESHGELDDYFMNLGSDLIQESYKSHVYPVLRYFYFGQSKSSINIAVLNLYDAIAFQALFPSSSYHLSNPKRKFLLNAIEQYIENLSYNLTSRDLDKEVNHDDFIDMCKRKSHKTISKAPAQLLDKVLKQRKKLLVYAYIDGSCKPKSNGVLSKKRKTNNSQTSP